MKQWTEKEIRKRLDGWFFEVDARTGEIRRRSVADDYLPHYAILLQPLKAIYLAPKGGKRAAGK